MSSSTSAVPASARRVVLGVSGGIAAYKACEVLRRLRGHNCDVTVVPTRHALDFVGATTWEALSGHSVTASVFDNVPQVNHVALGRGADLVLVVPASADLLARAVGGHADDLLSAVLLMATCPVVMAPAMHTQMWRHPATVANVAALRERGVVVLNPASGALTGPDRGPGRLPEPDEIVAVALGVLAAPELAVSAARQDMAGIRVVVSAGGTREPLDPVRYLGNASSGKMGIALARIAALRGAQVSLVAAHLEAEPPSGVCVIPVGSTAELDAAMRAEKGRVDMIAMAGAPADFTPAQPASTKIKKTEQGGLRLDLIQTSDVLAGLCHNRRAGQVIVGFAAETASDSAELLSLGATKLKHKGADLLVLNDVSGGAVFGADSDAVTIIGPDGVVDAVAASKTIVANHIWDAALACRGGRPVRPDFLSGEEQ